jgi:hypothetical protein
VQWQKFENFMNQAENTLNNSQANTQPNKQGTGSVYTLPNGQKVQVIQ